LNSNNLFLFPAFVPAPPVPQPPSSAPAPPAHPPPPHDDEPVSKKMKTEDNLIPEEEFLRRNKVGWNSNVLKICFALFVKKTCPQAHFLY